jgi:formylglycine-generating enzyme required for sulfatase activity
MRLATILALAALACAAPSMGCDSLASKDRDGDEDERPKKKKKRASDDNEERATTPTASAAPSATSAAPAPTEAAPPSETGATVAIPAGTLRAGHTCGAVPRVTDEELAGPSIAMGEFRIDAYPYPNEAGKPPHTGVSRSEAEALCGARGKRLCTELEWERACKGPDQRVFPYGDGYDKAACETPASGLAGSAPKCASGFGVRDTHGLAFEWTSSAWGRGKQGLATVRGHKGAANVVRERCASGQGRSPEERSAEIGFRCCSGPVNPAIVDLALVRQPVLVEDPRPSRERIAELLRAMPDDHEKVDGVSVSFDRAWRWHPRDNEELLVTRWIGQPDDRSAPFYELAIFKECGGKPQRVARMRGPVDELERLRDASAEKLVVDIRTDKDKGEVTLGYWYGSVKVTEPAWVKAGNRVERASAAIPRGPAPNSLLKKLKAKPR